jgi:hypothetical protein
MNGHMLDFGRIQAEGVPFKRGNKKNIASFESHAAGAEMHLAASRQDQNNFVIQNDPLGNLKRAL